MYRIFYLLFTATILFTSCNNDDDAGTPEPEEENFYALAVGNSWEYEYYALNTQTDEYELRDLLLTRTITGTTEIDGETYYNVDVITTGTDSCPLCDDQLQTELVRDSLGYEINEEGVILFSKDDENDYLIYSQPFGDIFGKLLSGTTTVDVEAGQFVAQRNVVYAILTSGVTSEGTDEILYSDGVGMVFRTISAVNNPSPLGEIRLKSYNLVEQ